MRHRIKSIGREEFLHRCFKKINGEIKTHQTRQCFCCLLLSTFGKPLQTVIQHEYNYCAFRFGVIHTLNFENLLSFCHLKPICPILSDFFTSTRHFSPHTAHLIFSFFWTILCKTFEMVVCKNVIRTIVS